MKTNLFFRVLMAVVVLTGLFVSTPSAKAAGNNLSYSYEVDVKTNYIDPFIQYDLGMTVNAAGDGVTDETKITVNVPEGFSIIGGSDCVDGPCQYHDTQLGGLGAGARTSHVLGRPTHDGDFTFKVSFKTGNAAEVVVEKTFYLHNIGDPSISGFNPRHPQPGQVVTLNGQDFLPLAYGETLLQMEFGLPERKVLINSTDPGVTWEIMAIQFTMPAFPVNTPINVTIHRGSQPSSSFQFTLWATPETDIFLPLVIH